MAIALCGFLGGELLHGTISFSGSYCSINSEEAGIASVSQANRDLGTCLRIRFVRTQCPSGDFLIPSNHLDSMDALLILDSRRLSMWTDKNRAKYNRDHLRYPSDLTDDEWGYVEPLIPPAKRGGGKRRTDMRAVMNGVMYILSTGCQWRYIPKDFPPRRTLHDYFTWWNCDGTLDRIHHALYVECREKAEREASPTALLRAVKVWPSKGGACRKFGATANLDSSCARRPGRSAGRDEETGFRSNKETDEGRKDAPLLNSLTKKAPYKEIGRTTWRATRCHRRDPEHQRNERSRAATDLAFRQEYAVSCP
jgi:transposase